MKTLESFGAELSEVPPADLALAQVGTIALPPWRSLEHMLFGSSMCNYQEDISEVLGKRIDDIRKGSSAAIYARGYFAFPKFIGADNT